MALRDAVKTVLKEKGYVCTDLWAACLIDKKTLTDILIKADPNCDAPAVLDDWLKEAHVVKLKVDPGVYEVCFEGYSHMFDNKHQKTQNALKDISVQGYIHKVR